MKAMLFITLILTFVLVPGVKSLPISKNDLLQAKIQGPMEKILYVNKHHDYFEGDIVLAKKQGEKNAIIDETLKWSSVIPYEIHSQYDSNTRSLIEDVLREISVRMCVEFVPRGNEGSYLMYTRGDGCYSSVGQMGGMQVVSIGLGCEGRGVIKHETMHALGFWHEQSRYDRDDYVEIVWENIQSGMEYNFDKYSEDQIQTLDEEYDYSSVMHYGPTAFSSNGEPTIVALYSGGENMGQRNDFSQIDLNKLRKLYNCDVDVSGWSDWTSWSGCDVNCKRHRKRFCEDEFCETSSETESTDCDHFCVAGHDTDCKSRVATSYGFVTSPLYPYNYKAEVECLQTIVAPSGEQVALSFETIDVEDYYGVCYYDWVKVYDGPDALSPLIATFCGRAVPNTIRSSGNALTVLFYSDYSVTMRGYLADYSTSSSNPLHVCRFEGDISNCGWTNDDSADFKWSRNKGTTPSYDTGPTYDHTTMQSEGYYMFIETSSPQTNGMKARLLTPVLPRPDGGNCLTFAYNMFGATVDDLSIYQVISEKLQYPAIFSVSGNHGNNWIEAEVTIYGNDDYQLAFEGRRGNGYTGDIAIDDVIVLSGECDEGGSGIA